MRSRQLAIIATLSLVAALGASPARAATPASVWVENGTVHYVSAGPDVNSLTVEFATAGFYLRDSVGTLALDPALAGGCTATERHVRCQGPFFTALDIQLGAGKDSFDSREYPSLQVKIDGGPDADTIHTGDRADTIDGGEGNDYVDAGAGDDTLYNSTLTADRLFGGPGGDTIDSAKEVRGGAGDDTVRVLYGGGNDLWGDTGWDTVDYSANRIPELYVSLDGNANDGSGEKDCPLWPWPCWYINEHNVHGDFERILGSDGDDHLTGNDEADVIYGGRGNDVLRGKGGDDVLHAGVGADQVTDGGSGDGDVCRGSGVVARPSCEFP